MGEWLEISVNTKRCSFVSRTVGKKAELMEPYLQALGQEIAVTGALLKEAGCTVRSVYIGGGTPTTLDTVQLAWLLDSIHAAFDLGQCLEFTVEAGRPDTLSPEKLAAIRSHGADRISINPQSMVDSVLRACGRPHTAADVLRSFEQASRLGFDAINMDLIAGLPTDSFAGFCSSLDTVTALNPGNITVHTLALKKGADLFEKRQSLPSQEEVAQMVDYAEHTLRPAGYRPYYLYRQKYMSGSFENVGWSRDSLDCLYNIVGSANAAKANIVSVNVPMIQRTFCLRWISCVVFSIFLPSTYSERNYTIPCPCFQQKLYLQTVRDYLPPCSSPSVHLPFKKLRNPFLTS